MIRELLSQTDLSTAPVLALVLFFALFAGLTIHAWLRSDEGRAALVLDDGTTEKEVHDG